jgi:hypothetical protein
MVVFRHITDHFAMAVADIGPTIDDLVGREGQSFMDWHNAKPDRSAPEIARALQCTEGGTARVWEAIQNMAAHLGFAFPAIVGQAVIEDRALTREELRVIRSQLPPRSDDQEQRDIAALRWTSILYPSSTEEARVYQAGRSAQMFACALEQSVGRAAGFDLAAKILVATVKR